jgi:hypothetical protein
VVFNRRHGERRGSRAPAIRLQEICAAVRCAHFSPVIPFCIGKHASFSDARSSALREQPLRAARAIESTSPRANAANLSAATSNFATDRTRVIDMTGSGGRRIGQTGVGYPAPTAIWPGSCRSDFINPPGDMVKGTLCLQ